MDTKNSIIRKVFALMLPFILICISLVPFVFSVPIQPAQAKKHIATAPSRPHMQATPIPFSYQSAVMIQTIAKRYMDGLLKHDYQQMWSLLHPQMQAKWASEAAFAAFWKARFQGYTLQNVTLGGIQEVPSWIDPETMIRYDAVEKIFVSLQLAPTHTPSLSFPPENRHPASIFQNLPFLVQSTNTQDEKGKVWYVLNGGPADTEAPLLPPLTASTRSIQVPILMYHHISDIAPPPNPRLWTVTIEHFTAQMDYLVAHGYHSITFNQLFNALYYGGPLPPKPVLITFDDGLEDAYTHAFPILSAHHLSAMFYIVSGKVGWDGQMTWPQLREMLAHGMQMGAHTIHHVNMGQVLLNSEEEAQQELQIPRITLQRELGIVIQHFCYPYGEPFYLGHWPQRQRVVELLAADGYIDATVAVGIYSGTMQTSESPFTLPRVPVFGFESLQGFANSLPWG